MNGSPYDPRNAIATSMMNAPQMTPPPGGAPQAGMFGATPPQSQQMPLQPSLLGGAQPAPQGMAPQGMAPQMPQPPLGGIGDLAGPTPSFAGNNSSMPFQNFRQY